MVISFLTSGLAGLLVGEVQGGGSGGGQLLLQSFLASGVWNDDGRWIDTEPWDKTAEWFLEGDVWDNYGYWLDSEAW